MNQKLEYKHRNLNYKFGQKHTYYNEDNWNDFRFYKSINDNNDRNHGSLYSWAIGIINSSVEYLINLDPDNSLEGKKNLAFYHYLKKII